MNVKLVSYSKPSDEFLEEGLENVQDLIAFCAKVSNKLERVSRLYRFKDELPLELL